MSAGFLLDTHVISELRRPRPHGAVSAWVRGLDDAQMFISAVSVGEIQAGIELTREQDPAKAEELERWLEQVASSFQVLPLDAACFRQWARLMHRKSNTLMEDALIAATAHTHRLTIATRNVADFSALGVDVFNPFEGSGVEGLRG
jgi:predicted nucleic acid-binding protein